MRLPIVIQFAAIAVFVTASPAAAQYRSDARSAAPIADAGVAASARAATSAARTVAFAAGDAAHAATQHSPPPYSRVLAGTTLGAVVGGAIGAGATALFRTPGDAEMFPADVFVSGVIGSAAGMYVGARLASGGQGSGWLTAGAAVGGTALGLLAGFVVGDGLAQAGAGASPEIVGIGLGAAIPLLVTSWTEWRTCCSVR